MTTITQQNLRSRKYNYEECRSLIRGENIPFSLGLPITRRCAIRGIRYHPGFGKELRGLRPEFTRALNARSIMSDEIPDMKGWYEFPYCIWHPETAAEETYRKLAHRYPEMKYQVGRACAVAGYFELYEELELLPEVHIAEEARDNGHLAIFENITKAHVKYSIMNDYKRTMNIDNPTVVPYLNGDTAVRSSLERKQGFHGLAEDKRDIKQGWKYVDYDTVVMDDPGYHQGQGHRDYFDITEDLRVDIYTNQIVTEDVTPYLYTPLLSDLPTVNKDLLILMAAYYGNIERYVRLRRPGITLLSERNCVIRGIYHNTLFAKWWSLQPDPTISYKSSITARFIMNNDLSRISPDSNPASLPYCIWYPTLACKATYWKLVQLNPSMKPAAARACIVADYQFTYDRIDPDPDPFLLREARDSTNPHYLQDIERKVSQLDDTSIMEHDGSYEGWKTVTRKGMFEKTSSYLYENVTNYSAVMESGWGMPYDGVVADMSDVELFVCAPEELRHLEKEFNHVDLRQVYDPDTDEDEDEAC